MGDVLCYGDVKGKGVSKLVNKMLASGTSCEELGIKIEIEEQKKISDYGDELNLLTRKK